jgi:3',5'-cyclic AMP phosphodiesterase CpdA
MSIIETKLNVGAETPFSVLHMADTHLTYADMRDGERKVALSERRILKFPHAERNLELASKLSKERGIPILHTGDLLDFVSLANLERVKKFTDENDCFATAGNHEFSLYVGEAKEDAAYRNQSLPAVQAAFKNDIRMASRIIGGVNFVALDNGYYLFDADQLAFLKNEAKKGLPMVLMMHTPLYEEKLYAIRTQNNPVAFLTGVPEHLMRDYPPRRYEQQLADELTHETLEYIHHENLIKVILAGHIHSNYEGMVEGRIPQITTAINDIRLIEFV